VALNPPRSPRPDSSTDPDVAIERRLRPDREHCQSIQALAVRAKQALNPRLRLAPAAEVSTWIAPHRPRLGGIESAVVDIIRGWTLDRGREWTPIDAIAISQLVRGVFPSAADSQTEAQRVTVSRAVKGLIQKELIRRIRGGHKGARRSDFFYLSLVEEILWRPHQHHDDDLGRDDADQVLDGLVQAGLRGERLWTGHVTPKPSGPRRHVTRLRYVSGNTAGLRLHVTPPNNPLTSRTLKNYSQKSYPHTCPPSPADRAVFSGQTA